MESSQNNTKTEYTPNEYVSYGTSGVCQIVSVEQRSFDGEHEESYYKLRPVGNGNSTYYVPVERAADRLRPLLTKEQIYGLIDEMADVDFSETEWCSNSRERRGIFQNILHSDDYNGNGAAVTGSPPQMRLPCTLRKTGCTRNLALFWTSSRNRCILLL